MVKKPSKIIVFLAVVLLCISFSGCESFITTPENLLSPPELTGEMRPISEALAKSVSQEYSFVYPASGEIRSPIALCDVDGDGTKEAFAFYSTENGESTDMHINYISKTKDGWRSLADNVITAGGVEKIVFCDISGDGKKEILVGWEVYGTTDKKLGVYSVSDGQLYERLMEQYTTFVCCDILEKGKQALVLQFLNQEEATNTAGVYTLNKTGINRAAGCVMDGKVKSVSEPIVSKLSGGKTALFIDEEKGAGSITEVLYIKDGELINPLLDKELGENLVTQRNSNIACMDIDNDSSLEIPFSAEAPGADKTNEKFYFTNWCSFDGNRLEIKIISVINQIDGYYLVMPPQLTDKIAISRDVDNRTRTFYEYNRETNTVGKIMFSVTAVSTGNYDKYIKNHKSAQTIYEDEDNVFLAEIYSAGASLSMYDIKEMFKLLS